MPAPVQAKKPWRTLSATRWEGGNTRMNVVTRAREQWEGLSDVVSIPAPTVPGLSENRGNASPEEGSRTAGCPS